ncbi:shikimate dehydrogenase [Rhizobiales bacterium RZME27]|uniref:Shikimate dehydrogenase (NADP(+)) n=1 Tax=Endobacterium cereale TaxID=2663029 RepID=A0A6A8A570_9HYPH|nr:shikimate dehydrogenase [Endobacterium cereale]MEB2845238.1 shikimate dehydrogenase [Endobacterium cereale]MQY46019.1 shikimate dehydrogenase [Endobacterium cereale]
MLDSRETKARAFVAGFPIGHSRSPLIHNHWIRQFGIDGHYEALEIAPEKFEAFVADLKKGESYSGGNVTIPHKEAAYQLADKPDELAEELGASNTLWLEDGLLHATNTDGHGFTANLDHYRAGWDQVNTAVILGAGGASRSVIQSLRNRGIKEIHVVNRTIDRARQLADHFGPTIYAQPMGALSEVLKDAGLFVNTTSLGMDGAKAMPIDFTPLAKDALVTDIVYVPLKTNFLIQAEEQGFSTVDGLGMLLHQAVPGFEKWFGRRPNVEMEVRQLVIDDMDRH